MLASKYQVRPHGLAGSAPASHSHNFQIAALPTIVLFKGGTPVDRIEGLPTAPQLIARVRSYL